MSDCIFWQTRHVLLNFGSVSFQFRILSTYSQWNCMPRCSNKGLTLCNIILSQSSTKHTQFLSSSSLGQEWFHELSMTAWTCWCCRCKQASWQHPSGFACQVKLTGLWQVVFLKTRVEELPWKHKWKEAGQQYMLSSLSLTNLDSIPKNASRSSCVWPMVKCSSEMLRKKLREVRADAQLEINPFFTSCSCDDDEEFSIKQKTKNNCVFPKIGVPPNHQF